MSTCTVCKQKASRQCEPECAFSDEKLCCLSSRTGCSCGLSLHLAGSCALSGSLSSWTRDYPFHKSEVSIFLNFNGFFLEAWSINQATRLKVNWRQQKLLTNGTVSKKWKFLCPCLFEWFIYQRNWSQQQKKRSSFLKSESFFVLCFRFVRVAH